MIKLMTPEKKIVVCDMSKDVCLYDAPRNPPNTGTTYTSGTDLYAHKARSGNWYYYLYSWSMWQGEPSDYELITEDEAKEFIFNKSTAGSNYSRNGVEIENCEKLFGEDFFEETA